MSGPNRRIGLATGFALALLSAGVSRAGPAPLWRLGDLQPGIDTTPDSSPTPFCTLGDRVLFPAANNGFAEAPLWTSDGTAAGTRRATSSPPLESGPMQNAVGAPVSCVVTGGAAYFTASSEPPIPYPLLPYLGLFRSDGTPAGSLRIVGSLANLPQLPGLIAAAGSRLIFTAYGGGTGRGVWSTDGTDAGTTRLLPTEFAGFGAAVSGQHVAYFVATPTGGVSSLWKTDGLPAGSTVALASPSPSEINNLTVVGDMLYFSYLGQLARTDGSGAIESLGDVEGPAGDGQFPVIGTKIGALHPTAQGTEFVLFDTATSTRQVAFTAPGGPIGGDPGVRVSGGRWLIRLAEGVTTRREWWSDGTAAGTALLPNFVGLDGISPAAESPVPPFLFPRGDGLLWRSDGTKAGTRAIAGSSGHVLPRVGVVGGTEVLGAERLFFANSDPAHGVEPWVVDPVAETVGLLADLDSAPFGSVVGSRGTRLGATAVFGTSAQTRDVWRTDGTVAGTAQLVDPSVATRPLGIRTVGEARGDGVTLFGDFSPSPLTAQLWRTDGTGSGTALIKTFAQGGLTVVQQIKQVGSGWLLQVGRTGNFKVWRSDGTSAGTVEANDLDPAPLKGGGLPEAFHDAVADVLLYAGQASADSAGVELWRSDGTPAGTSRVADLAPGPDSSSPNRFVADTGEFHALFAAGPGARELWGTDGTAAHTRKLASFTTPVGGHDPSLLSFRRIGAGLVLALVGGAYGLELWAVYDYGAAYRIQVWNTPQTGTNPQLVVAGDRGYFGAWDSVHGEELWVTDGFSAHLLVDAAPGMASGFATYPTSPLLEPAGDRVVFSAKGLEGLEPWASDGTAAGTRRLMDVNPGYLGSGPVLITVLANHWLLAANDGSTGVEPWLLRLAALTEPASVLGDLDADGDFDANDHALFAGAYGTHVGDESFLIAADMNGDGAVTAQDEQLWSAAHPSGTAAPIPIFPLLGKS